MGKGILASSDHTLSSNTFTTCCLLVAGLIWYSSAQELSALRFRDKQPHKRIFGPDIDDNSEHAVSHWLDDT